MKKITVSCIGLGLRADCYLSIMNEFKDKYEIISACDLNVQRCNNFKEKFNLKDSQVFTSDEEFFKEKRSELLMITTSDKVHIYNLKQALKAGYKKILVEKPFATTFEEIKEAESLVKEAKAEVFVCHVLRYAPGFVKFKDYIQSGKIGDLKMIDAIERVGIYHFSHSYVRGNYGVKEKSSPSIMAKCCHDLDLLVWFSDSLCESISSIGSLSYFTKENKPEGAASRCLDCKYQDTCYFAPKTAYLKYMTWAKECVTDVRPATDEAVLESLKTNKFGRCAFDCDNNVCDNQLVMMKFKNGVEASFKMTAFEPFGGRTYFAYGTKGSLKLDEQEGIILFRDLDGNTEVTKLDKLVDLFKGHGGGDFGLIDSLYTILTTGNVNGTSKLEYSIESHKMALLAEESRLKDGKVYKL